MVGGRSAWCRSSRATVRISGGPVLHVARSLEEFLAEVERRAFHIARFATGNPDDAIDLVQDAMLALAERYATREPEEWPGLFHRILQNRIRDWHRRQTVRRAWTVVWPFARHDDGGESAVEFADGEARSQSEQLRQARAVQLLQRAMTSLPLRQQQVVALRLLEGLDVNATARAMGCSEGSVKTHYSRALARLREHLGEHWP